ncbi:MAG: TatD family hydrolase [Saprospiraceae bacterium]|jgi:TatD DNase family protein|nr:TatD family hydrolase [Saprospiraceae bacterium]
MILQERPYIDFHTHKAVHNGEEDVMEIISMHQHIKNETDWVTLGYHPWWLHEVLSKEALDELSIAISTHPRCLALGECGLDGLKGAAREIQEQNFEAQLTIARALNLPVIIHCVRQFDRLLQIRKQWRDTQWVIHGYRRNAILTRQLLDEGIGVSVSPFPGMNTSFIDMLFYLPMENFYLETDSDHRIDIRGRYALMAELRKIDIFALRRQMYQNCSNLFQWKQ